MDMLVNVVGTEEVLYKVSYALRHAICGVT